MVNNKVSVNEEIIKEIINCSATQLIEMYQNPSPVSPILFPTYRSEKTRVSEQEARMVFIFNCHRLLFTPKNIACISVETPTKTKHAFNAFGIDSETATSYSISCNNKYLTTRSGQFDLCLHKICAQSEDNIEWVIEFKCGPCVDKNKTKGLPSKITEIYKDFEKMYLSNKPCIFFHILVIDSPCFDQKECDEEIKRLVEQYKKAFTLMRKTKPEFISNEKIQTNATKNENWLYNDNADNSDVAEIPDWFSCIVLLNKDFSAYYFAKLKLSPEKDVHPFETIEPWKPIFSINKPS